MDEQGGSEESLSWWILQEMKWNYCSLRLLQYLRMYWRKMDPEMPPEVDDGSQEDLMTGKIEGKEKESDPHNLEERFYRYGMLKALPLSVCLQEEWMKTFVDFCKCFIEILFFVYFKLTH